MAGQLKEVRNRIKSVQSTQQITKAMKMVSAANCAGPGCYYPDAALCEEIAGGTEQYCKHSEGDPGMTLAAERPVEKVLLIVITSDRAWPAPLTAIL